MDSFVYLVCLGVGVLFTLISFIFGHHFGGGHEGHVEGSGGHAEAGADSSDMPGVSIFSPTILAAFVTAFGAFGIILSQIQITSRPVVSAPLSVLGAVLTAGVLYKVLSALFRHTQGSS